MMIATKSFSTGDDDDECLVSPVEYFRTGRRGSPPFDQHDTFRIAPIARSFSQGDQDDSTSRRNRTYKRRTRVITRPPDILVPLPHSLRLSQGDTMSVQCQVYGVPKPDVKWLRNDDILQVDERIAVRNDSEDSSLHSLSIICVGGCDAGEYTIIAKNSAGEASSKVLVTVETCMDTSMFVHRRQICSIPEESSTEVNEALADDCSDALARFTCNLNLSCRNSCSLETPSYAISSSVNEQSVQLLENVTNVSATQSKLEASDSQEFELFYITLAIHLLCFAMLLFFSTPNDWFTDLRRFTICTVIFLLWCIFER